MNKSAISQVAEYISTREGQTVTAYQLQKITGASPGAISGGIYSLRSRYGYQISRTSCGEYLIDKLGKFTSYKSGPTRPTRPVAAESEECNTYEKIGVTSGDPARTIVRCDRGHVYYLQPL